MNLSQFLDCIQKTLYDFLLEIRSNFFRHINIEPVVVAQFVVGHASRNSLLRSFTNIAELMFLLVYLTYVSL